MAVGKKKPEEKHTNPRIGRSLRNGAEEQLAHVPKRSPDLNEQTAEELVHELQVHQIELETQAEELRKSKNALEEARDKFLDLYEFAPVGYLTLNDKALITEVNLTGATLLGVERSKLVNARFRKFIVPEDSGQWDRYFVNVLNPGEKQCCTLMLKRGDGSTFPARLEGVRIGGSGGVTTVRIAISDITDIWQIKALRVSEERLRLTLDAVNDGIFDWNIPTGTAFFSPRWYTMLGYEPGEIPATHDTWRSLVHPDDLDLAEPQIQGLIARSSVSYPIEYRMRTKQGDWKWILSRGKVIERDGENRPVRMVGTSTDITERKRVEEALRQVSRKLNLLSSITRHDINNQLMILMGYLSIVGQKQPDPTLNEYLRKVITAAQRISAMIRFTKEYEEIGVHAPVWEDTRTLVDTVAKQAPLGQVMVKNDLPAGTVVFTDPLVVKVFYNLMDNAVRHGGKITTLRFSVEERDGDQIIVCEDDGDGILAEEKEQIFDRGFGKNTGLGLALSREILSITDITIKETGEPGKGARFEITVPKGVWRMTGKGA